MKLGIALSGGGIRGIAHAGVLKALEDHNVSIDIVGGTSSGSMVASLYAMGYSPSMIFQLFKRYSKEIVETKKFPLISSLFSSKISKKVTLTGFHNGEAIEQVYDRLAARQNIQSVSQIKMPLVITTVDIMKSKEYIFTNYIPKQEQDQSKYITEISLGKAVRASSSFPAVFSPCKVEKYAFMDGGALDNVPVIEVKKQGADKVLAVKFDADVIDEKSNFMDIAMKTIDIMGTKIAQNNLEQSDYVLNVYTDKVGLLDIEKLDKCYKYGYESVEKNWEDIKNSIL